MLSTKSRKVQASQLQVGMICDSDGFGVHPISQVRPSLYPSCIGMIIVVFDNAFQQVFFVDELLTVYESSPGHE